MKKFFLLMTCAVFLTGIGIGCKGGGKSSEEPPSALESGEGTTITGADLTAEYVKILCAKYTECGIKAFKDAADCKARISTVLTKDAKWKKLSLDKTALKACLKDFKDFACEGFTSGKAPESCQKL